MEITLCEIAAQGEETLMLPWWKMVFEIRHT